MISLGVDIGGTGCKCVAFSDAGDQLALVYSEYQIAAGQETLSPGMLQDAVYHVISGCVEQLQQRVREIASLTISSFGESFVALDRDGRALGDILMYYGNTEDDEFRQLVAQVGEERFSEITRILPDASYSLSKMLITRRMADHPVWKYLFISGYICYCLTGRACTDVSLACRSLLYDVKNMCWSKELLQKCGIDEQTLPQVLPTGSPVGMVLPHLAERLQLPRTVTVVLGAHDQIVNALGAGVFCAGEAADTTGTCECITPLFSEIPEDQMFRRCNYACVPYLNDSGYVTYAYNVSAGSVIRWYRDALNSGLRDAAKKLGKSSYDLMNEQCPSAPTTLMVLPFLQGMGGTPEVQVAATGVIAGLTTQTRLPEIYRALLEGITYEMRYNQELLAENGIKLKRLYACGGGARSDIWLQIKADILGCEIVRVETEETGAMGSAILGFAAVTGEDPLAIASRFIRYGARFTPNSSNQMIYDRQYAKYRLLRDFCAQSWKKETQ